MFVTFVLSHEIETTSVKIQTDKRLYHQEEICEVDCMFDFIAVSSFNFNLFEILLNILFHTVVRYLERFKTLEIMVI